MAETPRSSARFCKGNTVVQVWMDIFNSKEKQMKRYSWFGKLCLLLCLVVPMALAGCEGDRGSTGPQGPEGPAGPAGPTTTTNESCVVCHTANDVADITVAHPDPSGVDLTVSSLTVTNAAGFPQVSFHVDAGSASYAALTLAQVRLYIADLVPAGTATQWGVANPTYVGTFPSPYYERWASEQSSTAGIAFDTTNAASGNYTITMVTGFGSAEALAEAPDYNAADAQRLLVRVSGKTEADGSVTNNTVGILDFNVPADGASATAADLPQYQKAFVTIDGCKKCHGPQMAGAAHANGYLDTRGCVVCHSPIGHYGTEMQDDKAYLTQMVHEIHAAIAPAGLGVERAWDKITFPQDVKNCALCHNNGGNDLSATAAQIDNWKNHPTREACGSCHTDVNFASGANHDGGIQADDSACQYCHNAAAITGYHDTTPTGINVPEFDITLVVTDADGVAITEASSVYATNGGFFKAGDTFTVTATLKDHATSADFTEYMTPQDAAYVAGGGLHVASLYVYGPRSFAKPLLGTQALSLFAGGTDTNVTTTASGFSYQVTVPDNATTGTYMVRTRFADYSYDRHSDAPAGQEPYRVESFALTNLQIGTATVENKVDGDACVNCHGNANFHQDDHAAPFDTDHCTACHDQSGGYADYIGNRVHAIHSANSTGDLKNYTDGTYTVDPDTGLPSRDWADVTFPVGPVSPLGTNPMDYWYPEGASHAKTSSTPNCVVCHNSGATSYQTKPYSSVCLGCHGDNSSANAHMEQNGAQF
jgi:OmcA/MtrC family decaheme c-type cytochrome